MRATPEMICTTTSMAKKKATDSSILCWVKLWPMARGSRNSAGVGAAHQEEDHQAHQEEYLVAQ